MDTRRQIPGTSDFSETVPYRVSYMYLISGLTLPRSLSSKKRSGLCMIGQSPDTLIDNMFIT